MGAIYYTGNLTDAILAFNDKPRWLIEPYFPAAGITLPADFAVRMTGMDAWQGFLYDPLNPLPFQTLFTGFADAVGLSPVAVVEKLGRDIAGSPETVRRVRRQAGRSGKDGHRVTVAEP